VTRTATIHRKTGETDVNLTLTLDGTGSGSRATGVGFLDHMLDLLARHGKLDLDVQVTGDLQTGSHHPVEDTGIVLGQALDQALGDRRGIVRYGHATIPMDEACAAKPSASAIGTPAAARAGAASWRRTSAIRRRKWRTLRPEAKRAAPSVGSVWFEPAT